MFDMYLRSQISGLYSSFGISFFFFVGIAFDHLILSLQFNKNIKLTLCDSETCPSNA